MAGEIRVVMPQLGESIVEATLVRWRVAPGDTVARGQILAEVETEKATNEIPAPAAGVIGEILVAEGATVPVGTALLRYGGPSAGATTERPSAPRASPTEKPSGGFTPRAGSDGTSVARTADVRIAGSHLAPRPRTPDGRSLPASPAVRRIAREHGIALDGVQGTGRRGRVTREDLLEELSHPGTGLPVATAGLPVPVPVPVPVPTRTGSVYRPPRVEAGPEDKTVPFSRRRTFIAEHMVHSLGTAAHVAAVVEIDLSSVLKSKSRDQAAAAQSGIKLTITAYAVAAVARALAEHPELNASVADGALILRGARNIGVAVDTAEGLVVPVIRRADELGLFGIARAIEALSEKAKRGSLSADDLSGGTFTVSNPGRDGNLFGISIIRQPEVGILRMGAITKRPVVREIEGEDAIVVRPMMFAALSYDHRVIDGRTGNAFLHRIRELLETTGDRSERPRPV